MAKKKQIEEKPVRQSNTLLIAGVVLVAFVVMYLVGRPSSLDYIPGDPALVVPIEVDPGVAEQNGQPLTNDTKAEQDQSLQQTQQSPQTPDSNLQGSPSTQSTAPFDDSKNPPLTP